MNPLASPAATINILAKPESRSLPSSLAPLTKPDGPVVWEHAQCRVLPRPVPRATTPSGAAPFQIKALPFRSKGPFQIKGLPFRSRGPLSDQGAPFQIKGPHFRSSSTNAAPLSEVPHAAASGVPGPVGDRRGHPRKTRLKKSQRAGPYHTPHRAATVCGRGTPLPVEPFHRDAQTNTAHGYSRGARPTTSMPGRSRVGLQGLPSPPTSGLTPDAYRVRRRTDTSKKHHANTVRPAYHRTPKCHSDCTPCVQHNAPSISQNSGVSL